MTVLRKPRTAVRGRLTAADCAGTEVRQSHAADEVVVGAQVNRRVEAADAAAGDDVVLSTPSPLTPKPPTRRAPR